MENMKSSRIVEIFNPDGTVTTYPSISSVTRSPGFKKGHTSSVYRYVARGGGRFVDIIIPVKVVNEDGIKITFKDINEVAETCMISTMEVYTMISNGKARLGEPIRKVLTKPIMKRKGLRTKCVVEVLNEDGMIDRTFNSIKKAAKVLGTGNTIDIYTMTALGKARFPLGEFVRATRSENKNSAT